jgi:NAD(P)-dependent dehydrogenase (short-subunit alcohol dehydrogenase family)
MLRRLDGGSGEYPDALELSGKRVLVTGASRGIGEALATAFAGAEIRQPVLRCASGGAISATKAS